MPSWGDSSLDTPPLKADPSESRYSKGPALQKAQHACLCCKCDSACVELDIDQKSRARSGNALVELQNFEHLHTEAPADRECGPRAVWNAVLTCRALAETCQSARSGAWRWGSTCSAPHAAGCADGSATHGHCHPPPPQQHPSPPGPAEDMHFHEGLGGRNCEQLYSMLNSMCWRAGNYRRCCLHRQPSPPTLLVQDRHVYVLCCTDMEGSSAKVMRAYGQVPRSYSGTTA